MRKKINEFFVGVKAEWKKIIWPSRKDLFKKSGAVVLVSAVTGALIVAVDSLTQAGIGLIAGLF